MTERLFDIMELMPLQAAYRHGKRTAPKGWKRNTAVHELHGCMAVWNYTVDTIADAVDRRVTSQGDDIVKLSDIAELLRGEAFVLPGEPMEVDQ